MPARVLAVVLGTVALAGCGARGTTLDAFVRQARAVCTSAQRGTASARGQLTAVAREPDAARGYARLATLTGRLSRAGTAMTVRLDAIPTPSGERDEIKAWIALRQRAEHVRMQLAEAYRAADGRAIASLSERVDELSRGAGALPAKLGVSACA